MNRDITSTSSTTRRRLLRRHWYTWRAMRDAVAGWYPTWPKGSASYPTRILGDTNSAILIFTDTPGMSGPGQVRNYGAVNFGRRGKIERLTAAWNGAYADDGLPTSFAARAIEY